MKHLRTVGFGLWVAAVLGCMSSGSVLAQGTAFTYQGSLYSNGLPVDGIYSMRFIARSAATNGTSLGSVTNAPVGVTNGLFTTIVDLGNVFTTSPLFLEIGVRTNGSTGTFIVLNPTQPFTSSPFSVQALNAQYSQGSASYLGGIADSQLSTNIANIKSNMTFVGAVNFSNAAGVFSGSFSGGSSGTFSGASTGTFSGTGTGTFSGNGAGLTSLNVTNLVGVVQSNPNWQIVQSSPQQAVLANNYLFTNNTQQTLILPASPTVGSTVWAAGSGGAGWKLSQNAGQSVLTTTLGLPAGQLWTAANSSQAYKAVACSGDGTRLAAAVTNGKIVYSPDGGITWANSDSPNVAWSGLASSRTGQRMAAGYNVGAIYTSTNGGTNWVQSSSPITSWNCVCIGASGFNIAAGTSPGWIYFSADGGTNWTTNTSIPNATWTGIACSDNARHITAVGSSTRIYVSSDGGTTFTASGPAAAISFATAAMSGDGTFQIAGGSGSLYVSGDSGATWVGRLASLGASWKATTCSQDGSFMAAAYSSGFIYTSHDYGVTWTLQSNGYSSAQAWTSLACSSTGSRVIGGISTATLYISTASTTIGTTGYLTGSQYSNVQLQYVGGGAWMPLSFNGSFTSF